MGDTHYELSTEEVRKIIENEGNIVVDNITKEQVRWGVYGIEDDIFDNVFVRFTEMDQVKWLVKITSYATHICAYKPHLYWSGRVFTTPQNLKDLGIEHK